MEIEHIEPNSSTAQVIVENEDHELFGLTLMIEKSTIKDSAGEPMARDIDMDREIQMEQRMFENRGHVESFHPYIMQSGAEFDFYFKYEGDASNPGSWSEEIRGNLYGAYDFVKMTPTGKDTVSIMFPEETADEEYEAKAVAIANTFVAPKIEEEVEEENETEE